MPETADFSAAPWLKYVSADEVRALKEKAAVRMRLEREALLRRTAELEADLKALAAQNADEWLDGGADLPDAEVEEEPSTDWSTKRLILHFVERNPDSPAGNIVTFVGRFKPETPEQVSADNVHSDLYKLIKSGKLVASGKRGSYRYSLAEDETSE